ncbi:MAG: hypothetical protein ACYDEQ_01405, partial [Desulfocucumaceae bacterium]
MVVKDSDIAGIKFMSTFIADSFPYGSIFYTTDLNCYSWKQGSKLFDAQNITIGGPFNSEGAEAEAIKTGKAVKRNIDEKVYDSRCKIISFPVFEGSSIVGTLNILRKVEHPELSAIKILAPLFSKLFPEGSFIYATDTEKMIFRQSSEKFDIPFFTLGQPNADPELLECLSNKKEYIRSINEERYGFPLVSSLTPMFDEDDSGAVIGVYGEILPRKAS